MSSTLYSLLPETEEIKFAKAVMELQSEVSGRGSVWSKDKRMTYHVDFALLYT